jgi:hypothetical protein
MILLRAPSVLVPFIHIEKQNHTLQSNNVDTKAFVVSDSCLVIRRHEILCDKFLSDHFFNGIFAVRPELSGR